MPCCAVDFCLCAGDPKGVMISHANLVSAIAGCNQYLESFNETLGEYDSYLSFLPLAHVFDRCACLATLAGSCSRRWLTAGYRITT